MKIIQQIYPSSGGNTTPATTTVNFTANLTNFNLMGLTESDMLSEINNNKVLFIWCFDDPHNPTPTTSTDLTPVEHEYTRKGDYFVKLIIQYQDKEFHTVTKVTI